MGSDVQRGKAKAPETGVSGARSAFGAPSTWLFLGRLHACRAGLRFARREVNSVSNGLVALRTGADGRKTVPGVWKHHRVSDGSSATRLRQIASERIQFWVTGRSMRQAGTD